MRWTVVESSYGGGGDGAARIMPRAGGSRLHVEYGNTGARRQRALLRLAQGQPMGRLVGRMWASALDRYARADDVRVDDAAVE